MKQPEKIKQFLDELSELTAKYNIEIGGCGCCGSPWVYDMEDDKEYQYLSYNQTKGEYEVWLT